MHTVIQVLFFCFVLTSFSAWKHLKVSQRRKYCEYSIDWCVIGKASEIAICSAEVLNNYSGEMVGFHKRVTYVIHVEIKTIALPLAVHSFTG